MINEMNRRYGGYFWQEMAKRLKNMKTRYVEMSMLLHWQVKRQIFDLLNSQTISQLKN